MRGGIFWDVELASTAVWKPQESLRQKTNKNIKQTKIGGLFNSQKLEACLTAKNWKRVGATEPYITEHPDECG